MIALVMVVFLQKFFLCDTLCHILGFPWKFGYITLQFEMFLFGPHGVSVYQWLSGPNIFLGKTRRPETLAMPKEPLVEISVWGRNWPGNKPSITFTVDLAVCPFSWTDFLKNNVSLSSTMVSKALCRLESGKVQEGSSPCQWQNSHICLHSAFASTDFWFP